MSNEYSLTGLYQKLKKHGRVRFLLIYMVNCIFILLFDTAKSKGGAVVRALASHQCGPGSNPGVDAICGLSLLLVLSLALRGFSPGTPVFPSPQKPTLPNSNSIWNARTRLNEFIWTLKCFLGKKAIYNFFFFFFFFYSSCLSDWQWKRPEQIPHELSQTF